MENPTISTLDSFKIKKGLSEKQINQLIGFSASDPDIGKFTSDSSRFKDRIGFDEFSTHILAYYTLVDGADNLAGIIWFDDFPHAHVIARSEMTWQSRLNQDRDANARDDKEVYGISFAIRLYGGARGKRLALPFTEKAMEDFKKSEEYKNHPHSKFWLSVSPKNERAVNLYRKLGFKDLELNQEYNKLLMILKD